MTVSFPCSAALALCLTCLSSALGAGVSVPSGLSVQVMDVITAEGETTVRYRYLAPDLGDPLKRPDFDTLTADLEALCSLHALPDVQGQGIDAVQIIISLSEKELPFGTSDPEVAQVFEAFSVQDGLCILEMF